jgi:hypothetical protein
MNGRADAPVLFLWLLLAVVFFGIGIWIARTPPEIILGWDRNSGYGLYHRVLKATGDEKKALAAAGRFYKVFGAVFCLMAVIQIALASAMLLFGPPKN